MRRRRATCSVLRRRLAPCSKVSAVHVQVQQVQCKEMVSDLMKMDAIQNLVTTFRSRYPTAEQFAQRGRAKKSDKELCSAKELLSKLLGLKDVPLLRGEQGGATSRLPDDTGLTQGLRWRLQCCTSSSSRLKAAWRVRVKGELLREHLTAESGAGKQSNLRTEIASSMLGNLSSASMWGLGFFVSRVSMCSNGMSRQAACVMLHTLSDLKRFIKSCSRSPAMQCKVSVCQCLCCRLLALPQDPLWHRVRRSPMARGLNVSTWAAYTSSSRVASLSLPSMCPQQHVWYTMLVLGWAHQ